MPLVRVSSDIISIRWLSAVLGFAALLALQERLKPV
jgi:hypothetical protein